VQYPLTPFLAVDFGLVRAVRARPVTYSGRQLDSLVLSGTRLTDSAVMSFSEQMQGGFLTASNLVFWNNGSVGMVTVVPTF
jgi:hypothetical protein